MSDGNEVNRITLYTSRWCAHSLRVEGFLAKNDISVELINIDGNNEARQELIELNGGYASVPTLVFPDGSKLTEPSFGQIRQKMDLQDPPGLKDKLLGLTGRNKETNS